MTTETKKASETPAKDSPKEEDQSALPTILAGAGILAVAALLIFWPSDDDSKGQDADGKAAAGSQADGAKSKGADGRAAGVGSRSIDAATTPEGVGRRNADIKLPAVRGGIAPMPEALPKDPPPTATHDEQVAFYEKRLEQAQRVLEARQKFAERLPQVQARVEASNNPEEGMKAFEKRKQIVEDNLVKAKQEVEEIEGKLTALRGG